MDLEVLLKLIIFVVIWSSKIENPYCWRVILKAQLNCIYTAADKLETISQFQR
jgi:hypothetical protein